MNRDFNLPPGCTQSDLDPSPFNDTCDCCGYVIQGEAWIDMDFNAYCEECAELKSGSKTWANYSSKEKS